MKTLILDASVGIKWFFEEEMSQEARALLGQLEKNEIKVLVPDIFFSEVANTCWVRTKRKLSTAHEANDAFNRAELLPVEIHSDHELSGVALDNSLQFEISAYDGLYLALAEIYVSPFVTADRTLFDKCKGRFDFIEYLGDFK